MRTLKDRIVAWSIVPLVVAGLALPLVSPSPALACTGGPMEPRPPKPPKPPRIAVEVDLPSVYLRAEVAIFPMAPDPNNLACALAMGGVNSSVATISSIGIVSAGTFQDLPGLALDDSEGGAEYLSDLQCLEPAFSIGRAGAVTNTLSGNEDAELLIELMVQPSITVPVLLTDLENAIIAGGSTESDGSFASDHAFILSFNHVDLCMVGIDGDNDGYDECDDCNDGDPAINPSATEINTDGIDNNCDGLIDVSLCG